MKKHSGFTLFELLIAGATLVFFGAILFVVGHFIVKFW